MAAGVRLYGPREAAEIMGITYPAMKRRIERRAVSCQKIGGRWTVALDPRDFAQRKTLSK